MGHQKSFIAYQSSMLAKKLSIIFYILQYGKGDITVCMNTKVHFDKSQSHLGNPFTSNYRDFQRLQSN